MKGTRIRAQRSDAIRDEAAWIPRTFDELEELRRRLTSAGHAVSVVSGVTGWLVGKALGEDDLTTSPTRSRYRKILRDLETSLGGPDDDPKRWTLPHRDGLEPPIIIVDLVLSGRERERVRGQGRLPVLVTPAKRHASGAEVHPVPAAASQKAAPADRRSGLLGGDVVLEEQGDEHSLVDLADEVIVVRHVEESARWAA